jgi:hypothetical protein
MTIMPLGVLVPIPRRGFALSRRLSPPVGFDGLALFSDGIEHGAFDLKSICDAVARRLFCLI